MPSNVLSADSEQLQQIAAMFNEEASMVEEVIQYLQSKYEPLRGGEWQGEAAEKFFAQMEDEVFPKLRKMVDYFERSAKTASDGAKTIEDQFAYVMSKAKRP